MKILAALFLLFLAFPAQADNKKLFTATTSPDLSVGATATADFVIKPTARWIAIKNDCTTTLYFSLKGGGSALEFPIRLEAGESFSGYFHVRTLGVSNDGAATCTFTAVPGR